MRSSPSSQSRGLRSPSEPSVFRQYGGSHEHDASTFTYHNRVSYANLEDADLFKQALGDCSEARDARA